MTKSVRILGICGSLRKDSFNHMALRAAGELLPEGATLETVGIGDLPHYDNDVFQAGLPASVERFRAAIRDADAILIASPEYNHSVPGVLKNAMDWASRPPEQPFNGKPGAIMGATTGMTGTARMQAHLRQICACLNMHLVNKPEVMIPAAASKFDAEGRLTDEKTRDAIAGLMQSLVALTNRLRA